MTLPSLPDGYEVTDVEWNAHVNEINKLIEPHVCKVRRTTVSAPFTGDHIMVWETAEQSTSGMWSSGNPERMYAPVDGLYRVTYNVVIDSASASKDAYIAKNWDTARNPVLSNDFNRPEAWQRSSGGNSISMLVRMVAGDYVICQVWADADATAQIDRGGCSGSLEYVAP